VSLFSTLRFVTNHPLNRTHKLQALRRLASWQLGIRLVPGAVVFEWVKGSKFLVKRGETGLTGNVYAGLHEFADMGYLLHALRSDELFIDVGANVGAYTILACAAIGARGYAFEPVPSTYQRLLANMRLNHLDARVTCLNRGVGAGTGQIEFTGDADTTNHVVAPGERCAQAVSVELTSLDCALEGEQPSMLKIDVEGYETQVLQGAEQTLKRSTLHSIIIELNGSGSRYGFDESQITVQLCDHGFRPYAYEPFDRTLKPIEHKNMSSGNTLFIRGESLVAERLRAAPTISLLGRQF
jgi:FkbM family methyltransferase